MNDWVRRIQDRIGESGREGAMTIAAIDGRCAAGKTTLASALGERYGYPVVHMDDFFLRPEQRTPERYATPGGNVDHERLLTEVLRPLRNGAPVSFRPFDCATLTLAEEITLPPAPVVLVEGSYACHPALRDMYDLRVFLDVDPDTQTRRILRRNGPEKARDFQNRWIPLEELYFRSCGVMECCDLILR